MSFFRRIIGMYARIAAQVLYRRPARLRNTRPLISFTFDDFPVSALHVAGPILEKNGARGTYYISLGLMGKVAPTGQIFGVGDLRELLARGHEVGCHTFDHCHSYDTTPGRFESSVLENRRALEALAPGVAMETLSYPISAPRAVTKKRCAEYFMGCRAGGQTLNAGRADLNSLKAFFLEQSRDNFDAIRTVIDANKRANGWLVFATHDVCDAPTRFGCTPEFFEKVVSYSVESGVRIAPVAEALKEAVGPRDSRTRLDR
jgi:peptidoglycan/xylan/chitin deacetylase (PgdA/CDA1 family)